jgi:hypothetical protein
VPVAFEQHIEPVRTVGLQALRSAAGARPRVTFTRTRKEASKSATVIAPQDLAATTRVIPGGVPLLPPPE